MPLNYNSKGCHLLQRVHQVNCIWFPPPPPPHVLCRHHHGAPPKRQPRPSQPGGHPAEGEPGALQGLHGVGGSGNMADSPADHQRQRWRPPPHPVAAGSLARGEVRATWQDDRNLAGTSTAPTCTKAYSSPTGRGSDQFIGSLLLETPMQPKKGMNFPSHSFRGRTPMYLSQKLPRTQSPIQSRHSVHICLIKYLCH